jgi:outer membrane protein insertion porin family
MVLRQKAARLRVLRPAVRRLAMRSPAVRGLTGAALLVACLLVVSSGSAFGEPRESGAAIPTGGLAWAGLPIRHISFAGVPANRLKPLDQRLEQAVGTALSSEFLKTSLRQLYATGLFDTVEVEGAPEGDGVALTFTGNPRTFIGTVSVDGAKGATVNTQLEQASQLAPGMPLTDARLTQAIAQMKAALALNGYPDPVIKETLTPHPGEQLTDISFHVDSGAQARVGGVEVTGEAGMSAGDFRHAAHLKAGAHVDRDTANRALDGVLKRYQNQDRLEADVKLVSEKYREGDRTADFQFSATRGPVVRLIVEGAGIESDRVRRLVPIFEEGSVDEDLLNEGNRRIRDYYERLGYFDVKVSHEQTSPNPDRVNIVYTVELGPRRRVEHVLVTGNHYFDSATLKDMLSVHAATALDRHGAYSQALVSADVSALEAVYRNNGFAQVKVTPETSTPESAAPESASLESAAIDPPGDTAATQPTLHTAPLTVTYKIDEGPQMRVGAVHIEGNAHMNDGMLLPLLNTAPGQLLSPQNLAGDRDALLTVYMSRGFDQVTVDIHQQVDAQNPNQNPNVVDVTFHIHEGEQIFVRDVLLTGIHYTRMSTVAPAITVHAGDPLNESALLDTQRNLYTFALFNEVNTAIENPDGAEPYKTVMLQAVEARRWTLTYGFGFEAQTGQPQNNCAGAIAGGVKCDPNGKTGVSPRVIADVTRNNVFGREQSASLQATYGLLEQRIQLLYQIPTFRPNLGVSFSGGYANSQDVTTYVASRLDAGFRLNQSFGSPGSLLSKANTFIYELDFRRVKVAASSLQVYPAEIPELATAVRVGGPSFTWIRDTRDSAMDAHRGTYTSFQEFLSAKPFGAQAEFDRIDTSNSSYYGLDKGKIVLARNTRYGQVRAFGSGFSELIPLPERLYAGGPTSMRGFSQNAAGPRDPETGFPIGGAGALINSTELRLPPPTLPWMGNSVSFVLFEDMGNVFANATDAWASALRIHQPDRDACKSAVVTDPSSYPNGYTPTGSGSSTGQQGACSFDYFSHAPGLGVRYHTPVGPIRFDFSYNLNPPIYPVNINYSIPTPPGSQIPGYATDPRLGHAPNFNFFFSLGQSF